MGRGSALEGDRVPHEADVPWDATVWGCPVAEVVASGSVWSSVVLNEWYVVVELPSSSLTSMIWLQPWVEDLPGWDPPECHVGPSESTS